MSRSCFRSSASWTDGSTHEAKTGTIFSAMPAFADERGTRILDAIMRAGGSAEVDRIAGTAGVDPGDLDDLIDGLADSELIARSADGKRLIITAEGRAFVSQANQPDRPTFGDE